MTKFDSQAFLNRLPNNEQSLRLQIRNSELSLDRQLASRPHARTDPFASRRARSRTHSITCTDAIEHGRRESLRIARLDQ